jgi:hypothetical protein
MKYLLNVFIQHKNQELFVKNLATELLEVAKVGTIKYFYGEQVIIFTFETRKRFETVKTWIDTILSNLSITHILTQVKNDKMTYWFEKDHEKHLFGTDLCQTNDDYTKEEQKLMQDSMYTPEPKMMDIEKFREISKKILEEILGEPKEIPTLDELLDKINASGIDSLTDEEKDLLTQYSK